MEKVNDGWHKLRDYLLREYEVYVEGGIVTRCICNGRIAYPYHVSWNGGWEKDLHMSFDDVRSGLLCANVVIT